MEWHFLNKTKIVHTKSGFLIELIEGEWSNLVEIKPHNTRGLTAKEQCKMIRLGLKSAKKLAGFDILKSEFQH